MDMVKYTWVMQDIGVQKKECGVVEIVDTEMLVPKDHLLQKIDVAVDFERIYEMVEPLYSEDNVRPSVDPVVLFKMVLIQNLYGLPSLRRTADEVSGRKQAYGSITLKGKKP